MQSRRFCPDQIPTPSAPGTPPGYWNSSIPTDLEIGCGVGWHAIVYGKNNPARRLIAIEQTEEKFRKFQGRLRRHPEISNVLPIHANAIHWVTHHVPSQSVQQVFILFPNPLTKRSQKNRRWHYAPFMERLLSSLVDGGSLTLATNVPCYALEAQAVLSHRGDLILVEKTVYSKEFPAPWGIRTHFEKKYLLAGQTCVQLRFIKNRNETPENP